MMLNMEDGGPPPVSGWQYLQTLNAWMKDYHLGGTTFIYASSGRWETHSYRADKSYWEWMLTDVHNSLNAAMTAADNYSHNRITNRR